MPRKALSAVFAFVVSILLMSGCGLKLALKYTPAGNSSAIAKAGKSIYVDKFSDERPAMQNTAGFYVPPGFEIRMLLDDNNIEPSAADYARASIADELGAGHLFSVKDDTDKGQADYILKAGVRSFDSAYTKSAITWLPMASFATGAYMWLQQRDSGTSILGMDIFFLSGLAITFCPVHTQTKIAVDYIITDARTSKVVFEREYSKITEKTNFFIATWDPGTIEDAMREVNRVFLADLAVSGLARK